MNKSFLGTLRVQFVCNPPIPVQLFIHHSCQIRIRRAFGPPFQPRSQGERGASHCVGAAWLASESVEGAVDGGSPAQLAVPLRAVSFEVRGLAVAVRSRRHLRSHRMGTGPATRVGASCDRRRAVKWAACSHGRFPSLQSTTLRQAWLHRNESGSCRLPYAAVSGVGIRFAEGSRPG